jgi:hypothetical protein
MMTSVTGVYTSRDAAERGLRTLEKLGFRKDEVSLFMSGPARELQFSEWSRPPNDGEATADAATGATLGTALGSLAAVASLSIAGGLFVAGPVGAAVAGAAAGGAGGGLFGVLVGAGIREEEARIYQNELGRDGILIRVTVSDEVTAAIVRSVFETTQGRALGPLSSRPPHVQLH